MSSVDMQQFLILRKHLKIVHHVDGRIRLRIAASILKDMKSIDKDTLKHVISAIDGIKDVRMNMVAATIVISYRVQTIEPTWWHALIDGDDDKAIELLEMLITTNLTPALKTAVDGVVDE